MSRPPRRLGARLLGWTITSTVIAVLVFAATATTVVWIHEMREAPDADDPADEYDDDVQEVALQLGVALAVTTPVVLLLAALTTRLLARRVTSRIDAVIAAATRMTSEDLGNRLPVSSAGDELDALAVALNGLFARLDSGIRAQRQFIADASHELRTPLTVLRSELEVARRRPRTLDDWDQIAGRAHDEVVTMITLVEALLQLARADAVAPRADDVTVADLLDDVVTRRSRLAAGADVRVEVDAPPDLHLRGDPDTLAVAVGNLVGNAISHSPAGGAVRVHAARIADRVEITVDDEGHGVPPADRERIFLPFARGSNAADRSGPGGIGLGLSVSLRILEAHRGSLRVDDAPGGGARFVAALPAAAPLLRPPRPPVATRRRGDRGSRPRSRRRARR
jgi:two-component system OmpR family sensor kinase